MDHTNEIHVCVIEIDHQQFNHSSYFYTTKRFSTWFKIFLILCAICCWISGLFYLFNAQSNDVIPNLSVNSTIVTNQHKFSTTVKPSSIDSTEIEIWNPEKINRFILLRFSFTLKQINQIL